MPKITCAKIKREVLKRDPGLKPDHLEFKATVVLLSSTHIGPNIRRLAAFTGFSIREITNFSRNLRKSQIWRGPKVYADWFGKDGGIALACDTCVALGYIERSAA